MQIFVINLEQDVARLAFMDRQLRGQFGLDYTRHPAALGKALQGDLLRYRRHPLRAALSDAEAGCLISHIQVWRRIAEGQDPCALVMEDDVHCAPGFGALVHALAEARISSGVHRLETVRARVSIERRPSALAAGYRRHRLFTNHAGAAAYIISRDGAREAVAQAARFQHLPDTELFDPARRTLKDLQVYQWLPAPCVQDMHLGDGQATGFASHLESDRLDYRTGHRSRSADTGLSAKQTLRPLYTALYAAALAPLGRNRVLVGWG